MPLVIRAKRSSDMATTGAPWLSSVVSWLEDGRRGWFPEVTEEEEPLVDGRLFLPGRQRRTASTEARQGWIWRGMLKVTRITIAALAIVEATDAGSAEG